MRFVSFWKMVFIGQNLKHVHMTYYFFELLIFFWLTVCISCYHTKEILYVNTNFIRNQSWNKNKSFQLFLILMLKKLFLNVKLKLLSNKFWFFSISWTHFQKQPFAYVLQNRCSWNFAKLKIKSLQLRSSH